jgi:hypothetical protein
MTRRDLATAGFCGLLFAAVVVVASRRPAGVAQPPAQRLAGAPAGAETLARSEGLPEIRRVVQYMLVR